jgi:hypothetical protein
MLAVVCEADVCLLFCCWVPLGCLLLQHHACPGGLQEGGASEPGMEPVSGWRNPSSMALLVCIPSVALKYMAQRHASLSGICWIRLLATFAAVLGCLK